MATAEHPLPARQNKDAARKAEGYATPKQDKIPQCARFPPIRILPIIFLPGIMGSNLRMSAISQKELKQDDNIAWRPDGLGAMNITKNSQSDARERQLRLDPLQTTVDIYDPDGPREVSGDERHGNVKLNEGFYAPLLQSDAPTVTGGRSAVQKARSRGWGEVYFKSYGLLLQHLESRLNKTFREGRVRKEWRDVIGVDPRTWAADQRLPQQALTEEELRDVVRGCWFAVHAFGYNWLQSNGDSARIIAQRIKALIDQYNKSGYECNQVIVVTHSMGGLVGRALVHPDYGDLRDKVLGIVHGVMPAIGAPAAYKRMRAGFEDPGLMNASIADFEASVGAKVAGNYGDEVTGVLANAPGGLQLLPSESYGNSWLRVRHNNRDLDSWPKQGNPYDEIYTVRNRWYGLFREEWINPSGYPEFKGGGTFERTCLYLKKAQQFHRAIAGTYHPNSYAHYGADMSRPSFEEVVWDIQNCADSTGWEDWQVSEDNRQGWLKFAPNNARTKQETKVATNNNLRSGLVSARILAPSAPGDQTVPAKSADHQLHSGHFKGIFRQTGYEHQSSYKDPRAIASTLYSIIRIAQSAKWNC